MSTFRIIGFLATRSPIYILDLVPDRRRRRGAVMTSSAKLWRGWIALIAIASQTRGDTPRHTISYTFSLRDLLPTEKRGQVVRDSITGNFNSKSYGC